MDRICFDLAVLICSKDPVHIMIYHNLANQYCYVDRIGSDLAVQICFVDPVLLIC
jgi:hypothetical protein